ncbi:MAG: GNAT family N-acetyltransferase, partial [Patescibacteria group bacterium]|nr:GNAT family N-acetyltransferase [Patescibacteria group bacterium]
NIIGSVRAFVQGNTCYIGRLAVHPDFQNQGIGSQLVNEIENTFKTCTRFELFTGHKSEKNIRLYQKLGYETFKTEKITEQIILVYLEKIRHEHNF